MILIVAPEDDLHAQVVSERLAKLGAPTVIWNTTWFPWRHNISWTLDDMHVCIGSASFDLSDISRVWWRRYHHPTPSPAIEDEHVKRFCASEAAEVLKAVADTAPAITNDPRAERRADSKLLQLRTALAVGLALPRTLVSNDATALREFVSRAPQAIVKPLVCDYPHSIETRVCSVDDFADENSASLAPTLVQELVYAVADIRVSVVGSSVFAGELRRSDINDRVDWRMTASGWRPHLVPDEMRTRLVELVRRLSLECASVDLRLTSGGEYVFLEVNPSGQFLFLELMPTCRSRVRTRSISHFVRRLRSAAS